MLLTMARRHEGGKCSLLLSVHHRSVVVQYLLPTPSIFNRAAEALLSQIQKNYQKPQGELEVLKAAASSLLSKHTSELQTAGDLAREAEVKARESDRLVHTARANLQEFRVSLQKDGLLPSQGWEPSSPMSIIPFLASFKMSPKF